MKLNTQKQLNERNGSPSARKVWIEIVVYLLITIISFSHLPRGRCGLKSKSYAVIINRAKSPSARKVWIEMFKSELRYSQFTLSPSARKVWIEIRNRSSTVSGSPVSPSARKVWIEINL